MSKRLQVLMDDAEYREIQSVARGQRVTVAEWVRQALRKARNVDSNSAKKRTPPEVKLRAIAEAYKHNHPTADIDQMLEEIEIGRNLFTDLSE